MMLNLYDEYDKYHFQYSAAIFRLLDNNPNIDNMIYPLANLIHQKIENELKQLIVEPHVSGKTFKDFKVDNTHNLDLLLSNDALKKYYKDIEICEIYFKEYRDSVLYFYEILGEDTFLSSRYPIERKENTTTVKKEVDFDALYANWTKYSLACEKMIYMYMAYCSSNTILHLKKIGKIKDASHEEQLINNIIENSFKGFEHVDLEEDKKILNKLIKEFVKRNKYFDIKYVS